MILCNNEVRKLVSVEIKGTLLVYNFNDGRTESQILRERKDRHRKLINLTERYFKLTGSELEIFKQLTPEKKQDSN